MPFTAKRKLLERKINEIFHIYFQEANIAAFFPKAQELHSRAADIFPCHMLEDKSKNLIMSLVGAFDFILSRIRSIVGL